MRVEIIIITVAWLEWFFPVLLLFSLFSSHVLNGERGIIILSCKIRGLNVIFPLLELLLALSGRL